jgi:imidazolonepropionase-like amidohydrolase
MMAERGIWLVPTLLAAQCLLDRSDALPPAKLDMVVAAAENARANVRRALDAGVKIAMGSDCPMSPHGTNLRELALMSGAGLGPARALQAATINAAQLLRVDP